MLINESSIIGGIGDVTVKTLAHVVQLLDRGWTVRQGEDQQGQIELTVKRSTLK